MEAVRKLKASIFQGLAHPTRLAIVELVTEGEMSVGGIMQRLGVEQPTISRHLAILRAKRIVASRKDGNQVLYSLRDPILKRVLDLMRRYTVKHLAEDVSLLAELEDEKR
ncbi:MAG: ArsR/SmtB family transcription factor [Hyphomicrobiales bacterium]